MKFIIVCLLLVQSVQSIDCPLYCKCHMQDGYRYVGCVNKNLISIDLELPTSVQWLQLDNNSISTLNNYVFMQLKLVQVERLDLNRNMIGNIQRHAFRGMDKLNSLQLGSNHIYHLDPHTFEFTNSLIVLDLSNNPLRSLPEPFLISPSVQVLLIRSCNLGYLSSKSLSELRSLRTLDLSNNQLNKLQLGTVENIPTIKHIIIYGNRILCGKETRLLLKYLESKNIQLHDHGCTDLLIAEDPPRVADDSMKRNVSIGNVLGTGQDEKFQRMVIMGETDNRVTEVYQDTTDVSDTLHKDTLNKCLKQCHTNVATFPLPDSYDDKGSNVYSWLILVVVFATGLSLGALLAYTSVALYSLYWKCHKRRREEETEVRHVQQMYVPVTNAPSAPIDPNTPPPNYYQLFNLSSNRR